MKELDVTGDEGRSRWLRSIDGLSSTVRVNDCVVEGTYPFEAISVMG